jgi:predicted nucleic acid-binding protein
VSAYIDASVLVTAILNEPRSQAVRDWRKADADLAIVSDLAILESVAVIARAVRTKRFVDREAEAALRNLDALRAECVSHAHPRGDFALAEELIRDFSTKPAAPDALHLAATINVGAALATLDLRLAEAARPRGVELVEID